MDKQKSKIEYKPAYTDEDTGIGLLVYIVMQGIIFFIARGLLSAGVPYTNWFYYIYAFFVEAVFALAVLFVCGVRKRSFVNASGFNKKINFELAGLCIGISLICLLGLGSVSDFFLQILEWLGYSSSGAGIQVTTFGELVIYTILIAIMPAICEELLFRGLMLNGLAKYGKNIAVYVSAFAFMIMHGSPDQTVHQFILGVIFGYIVYYTGNLWLTIIIHFCNNFFVLLFNFIYNISSSGNVTDTATDVIAQPASIGYEIVNYIISVVLVVLSIYLIYSAIKRIVIENKNLNGLPNYVEEKDKKFFGIEKDLESSNEQQENVVIVEKADKEWEEQNIKTDHKKPKLSLLAIILLVAGNIYLIVEWIIALVQGFAG